MPKFNEQAIKLICNWDQALSESGKSKVIIKLITTDNVENSQFINLTKKLTDAASNLIIELEKSDTSLPAFQLKENITYSALPLSRELEPFLEALSLIDSSESQLSDTILQSLDTIDIPVNLKLYIAVECPHCPSVVRRVIPLAMVCKNIHLQIIDGTLFPETARKDGVMSAPSLILDDDFRWTGEVTEQEIIKMITERDSSQLSPDTLKNILEEGDASWIAGQMLEKRQIFDNFIKLLLHEIWSVRLGAMVVVEELAEADPELAANLCPKLIEVFDEHNIPVQGDILYALGEAGSKETKKWIEHRLEKFEHQELIDAAEDAIDSLNG